jgi:hypothetical protein
VAKVLARSQEALARQATTKPDGILLLRQNQARVAMAAAQRLGHERFVEDPLAAIIAFTASIHGPSIPPATQEAA